MDKVINTREEYFAALAAIEELIDRNLAEGTEEANRLELLIVLVQDYEARTVERVIPDPIEAILFRMEQQNLAPRDLIPYIGSRNRVSEVLSGKRPLTLDMVRALNTGLGIPAEALLQERAPTVLEKGEIDWGRFPLKEMVGRGWIKEAATHLTADVESLLRDFFGPQGSPQEIVALYRQTNHYRSARSMDRYALAAWTAQVMHRAMADPTPVKYQPGTVTIELMRQVVRLSPSTDGPIRARDFLSPHGISVVVEPHLPHTHLDGAAIMFWLDRPVIGLTLRYDRLDNFWFCLMHELAHVALHYGQGIKRFYDDLDIESGNDPREKEADDLAGEALIPEAGWQKSAASRLRTPEATLRLARELGIHPAIVAGRVRHAYKSYRVLKHLVGFGEVRRCFPEVQWKEPA